MKIYLAGPLFTVAERNFNRALADKLHQYGFEVWLPQAQEPRDRTAYAIFEKDVEGLDWCNVVVANMDGPDPDSGTCWECGYAYAKSKPVVTFRTDMRSIDDGGLADAPYNIMLSQSARVRIECGCDDTIKDIAARISNALTAMESLCRN